MAAVVTTPVNVSPVVTSSPTFYTVTRTLPTVTYVPTPTPILTNVSGVKRLVMPPPLSRWNGTAWVVVYAPRI